MGKGGQTTHEQSISLIIFQGAFSPVFLQKVKLRPREVIELSSGHTVSGVVRNSTQNPLTLKPGPILFLFAAQENSGPAQEEIPTVISVIPLSLGSCLPCYLQDLACA